jgi:aryl-alcohol dehydrogenase-like predicted oxidoreductase
MDLRPLGSSGLLVPVLSLASWPSFAFLDDASSLEVLSVAIDAGITFFDHVPCDDPPSRALRESGYPEIVFSRLLRRTGCPRDRLVLAHRLWIDTCPEDRFEAGVDELLSLLRIDHLDLLYSEPPSRSLSMERLVAGMHALRTAGKIRAWGGLNWTAPQIEAAHQAARAGGWASPAAVQVPYGRLRCDSAALAALRKACAQAGAAIVASAGFAPNDAAPPELARGRTAEARELRVTPAQLELALSLVDPQVCSALFVATKAAHAVEALASLALLERLHKRNRMRPPQSLESPAAGAPNDHDADLDHFEICGK